MDQENVNGGRLPSRRNRGVPAERYGSWESNTPPSPAGSQRLGEIGVMGGEAEVNVGEGAAALPTAANQEEMPSGRSRRVSLLDFMRENGVSRLEEADCGSDAGSLPFELTAEYDEISRKLEEAQQRLQMVGLGKDSAKVVRDGGSRVYEGEGNDLVREQQGYDPNSTSPFLDGLLNHPLTSTPAISQPQQHHPAFESSTIKDSGAHRLPYHQATPPHMPQQQSERAPIHQQNLRYSSRGNPQRPLQPLPPLHYLGVQQPLPPPPQFADVEAKQAPVTQQEVVANNPLQQQQNLGNLIESLPVVPNTTTSQQSTANQYATTSQPFYARQAVPPPVSSQPYYEGLVPAPNPYPGLGSHVSPEFAALTQALLGVTQQQAASNRTMMLRNSKSTKLMDFKGNPLDWPRFEERYRTSTTTCAYSNPENINRLQDALKDEAKTLVGPLLNISSCDPERIMKKLKARYGRPELIIRALRAMVEKVPAPKEKNLGSILDFSSAIDNLVTTIKSLRTDEQPHLIMYLYDPHLLQQLADKLPESLKLKWGKKAVKIAATAAGSANLGDFSAWLEEMSNAVSYVAPPPITLDKDKDKDRDKKKGRSESNYAITPSTSAPPVRAKGRFDKPLSSTTTRVAVTVPCPLCKAAHFTAGCPDFKQLSVDDRWAKVKELRLCFKCLRKKCSWGVCKRKVCGVNGCDHPHHYLLHGSKGKEDKDSAASPSSEEPTQEVNGHHNGDRSSVILRILPVTLFGPKGEKVTVNAIVDEASTVTLISDKIAKQLHLNGPIDPLRISWTNGTTQKDYSSRRVQCWVSPIKSKEQFVLKKVRTVKELDLPAQDFDHEKVLKSHPHLKGVRLHILPGKKPEILIGQAHIHLTVARAVKEGGPDQPMVTETKLGWVLHGPMRGSISGEAEEKQTHHVFACTHQSDDDILHQLVKESFSLESVGIKLTTTSRSREDTEAEQIMEEVTRQLEDGRWETGLLWRREFGSLGRQVSGVGGKEVLRRETDLRPEKLGLGSSVSTSTLGNEESSGAGALSVCHPLGGSPLPSVGQNPTALSSISALPPSYGVAYSRMLGVERKLRSNEILRSEFFSKVRENTSKTYYRKLSPAEAARPTSRQWYLPILIVFNPNKPRKIRIVMDARDLNKFLLTGPDLYVSLPSILINFRIGVVAYCGDIDEFFPSIMIREQDQPAQRFILREDYDKSPDVYEYTRLLFGSVGSPYQAQCIRDKNANMHRAKYPEAAKAITTKHYMDDYADTSKNDEEAIKRIKDVTTVHAKGAFKIRKWISNSPKVLESIPPEDRVEGAKDLTKWSEIPTERALGLHWNPGEDVFVFKLNVNRAGEGIASGEQVPTKRDILRLIMLIWDPLGFLSYFIIKAKILMQQLWRMKVDWNEQVPELVFAKWRSWVKRLPKVEELRIPRCYEKEEAFQHHLHIFSDASEQAYCAVAYLAIYTNSRVTIRFLMGKSRVAPLKPLSIPKLELQAALIASRMGKFLQETLEVPVDTITYWTDSATVLKWLRNDARRFQVFVSGRVGEIQTNSEVMNWRWVPTKFNPADEGTRDGKCDLGGDSRWFVGPEFLHLNREEWPEEEECKQVVRDDDLEWKKEIVAVVQECQQICLPIVTRFSRYLRLRGAAVSVLKCCDIWRKRAPSNIIELTTKAERLLLFRSQCEDYPEELSALSKGEVLPKESALYKLSPVLDEYGMLRMKSRLVTAEEEGIRLPIIIHPKNPLTKLIILHYHRIAMHQGEEFVRNELRQRYWIPRIRTAVRGVIRNCGECKLKRAKAFAPLMGNLPSFRIERQSRPFTITGMDYFGPYQVIIKRSTVKMYGVIFTCLSTRAIHLEVADDLTTDACIMAIRRFIGRRGQPKIMWSDNGTNLRGTNTELGDNIKQLNATRMKDELAVKGIEFNFIPARSPHFGATWERMVKSVKVALSSCLKGQSLKPDVLHTLFVEVEAIVNSRPLVPASEDPDAPEALTPFHFLIGTSSTIQPPGVFNERDLLLNKRWRRAQALADMFWKRWSREYIPTLQPRKMWHETRPNVEIGEVVLVFDESLRRGSWPLGIVVEVFPGKDGIVRVVKVKIGARVYKRPVVKLGRLEMTCDDPGSWHFRRKMEGESCENATGNKEEDSGEGESWMGRAQHNMREIRAARKKTTRT